MSKLAFEGILSGPVAGYVAACKDLGGLLEKQAGFVEQAFKEEMAFLNKASAMAKPSDDEFQAMLAVIGGEMGKVASVTSEAAPRSPLENHLTAVSESIGALGWVAVDPKPVPYIGDMEQAGEFYLSKILMQYKKTEEFGKHERFAKSLRQLCAALKAYVKEYHTTSLQWNAVSRKTVRGPASTVVEEQPSGVDELSSFEEIISGPLASYVAACKDLGDLVEKQAGFVSDVFKEELTFLTKVSAMAKPSDDEFQAMLAVIGGEMGKVASVTSEAAPRSPLENHLTAVSESIGALGWVAVDSKPVPYIGDMEQAGEFYLSKILMQYKKTEEFGKHERFVKSLRELCAALKAYVKEYHTTSLQWNTASRKTVRGPASTVVEEQPSGVDELSSFEEIISGPLASYVAACKDLGDLVEKQAGFVSDVFKEELTFLTKVSAMAKPSDDEFQAMLAVIGGEMGTVASVTSEAAPRSPLENHLTAVSESIGALGWVGVDSKPVPYIGDMEQAGEFYLSKILMQYKKTEEFGKHERFVKSLRELCAALKAYVKEYHTTSLQWNTASRKTVKGSASAVVEEESSGTDPLSSFEAVLSGSVEEYSKAAKELGGLVEEQSTFFVAALKEEFKLLQNASKMAKPGADAFQAMLTPIAENMGKVGEIASQAPPRDPFQNHLNALSESVGALGWVAVDSTPVPFIADMAAAGEFYISKLLMEYKKKDDFAKHEAFSKNLKAVYADLKKYVKKYHTTQLSWNYASSS
ncbi:hypothetical protein NDN08_005517 [Rhodosorus marinus]|uniref:CAP N-terminal domain-containing protein n=1 Tax=Rhodosorus marinus TaxID=101924 RepID=A0AAV8V4I1_9RHOD|nr:hypothetical protein NDN08_005517 [Rhodosorus marinus]